MVERGNGEDRDYGRSGPDLDLTASASHNVTVSEARLETVLETAVDGILVTNDRGRILMFNDACENMFGYKAHEVLGRNVSMLMRPRHGQTFEQQPDYEYALFDLEREEANGTPNEVIAKCKDGSLISVDLTVGEANTPAGRQFVGVLRDLTQRETVRKRIEELQQQIVRTTRHNAVDEVGAAIAHELKQPLTALTLYLQALELKTRQIEDFDKDLSLILEKALKETERTNQIIQRMRRFGKRVAKKFTTTDINQLIVDAVELATVGYSANGVEVETDLENELLHLQIDPIQIEQILVNLLRNAIEAVTNEERKFIKISSSRDDEFIAISVEDSGSGIPENIQGTIFNTFASSKVSGMGLGLAISNTIAQSHGGHFAVDPGGNGRGATFTLKLPCRNLPETKQEIEPEQINGRSK